MQTKNRDMSKNTNTTQDIAIDFAQRAVSSINRQLAVEIERNGFSMDLIRKGKKQILARTTRASDKDPRYIIESFSVSGKNIPERILMVVKWSPKGFLIERNSDEVANAIKANKNFGVKKGQSPLFVGELTEREVEIEALASKYEEKYENDLKKASGLKVC